MDWVPRCWPRDARTKARRRPKNPALTVPKLVPTAPTNVTFGRILSRRLVVVGRLRIDAGSSERLEETRTKRCLSF